MAEKIVALGKNEGVPFPEFKEILSVKLIGGSFLDSITINGEKFGGDGGKYEESLTLAPEEYFSYIYVRSGNVIDFIGLRTNWDRHISIGGWGGEPTDVIKGGRLLGISGMVGPFKHPHERFICRLTFRIDA